MNLKFDFDFKKSLPALLKLQPYLFGLLLIGVFGYTAYIVNAALNVKPAETATTTAATGSSAKTSSTKITFDKATIEAVKKLQVVQGDVPSGDLGTANPF